MGMSANIMIGSEFELSDKLLNYFIRYHGLQWEDEFKDQYKEFDWEMGLRSLGYENLLYGRMCGGKLQIFCFADDNYDGEAKIDWINKMAKKLESWGSSLAKKYKSKHRVILFPYVG